MSDTGALNPVKTIEKALLERIQKSDAKVSSIAKEVIQVKNEYNKVSLSTIGTKALAAGAVLGVQLIKVDISALKIDEKGITWLGDSKVKWPWTKDAKNDKAKKAAAEEAKESAGKAEAEVKKIKDMMPTFLTKKSAAQIYSTKSELQALKDTLRSAGEGKDKGGRTKSSRNPIRQFGELKTTVNDLSTALAGIE